MTEITVEWRVCSDGVSSPPTTRITEAEAKKYLTKDLPGSVWIERREVTPWTRVAI